MLELFLIWFSISMFSILGTGVDYYYGMVYRREFGSLNYIYSKWWRLPFGVFVLYQIERKKREKQHVE